MGIPIRPFRVKMRNTHREQMFSALPPKADSSRTSRYDRFVPILLQKSKVASVRIFGETLRYEAIDDSDNLSRATEVAYEFSVRG